jgi:hypothetical protein
MSMVLDFDWLRPPTRLEIIPHAYLFARVYARFLELRITNDLSQDQHDRFFDDQYHVTLTLLTFSLNVRARLYRHSPIIVLREMFGDGVDGILIALTSGELFESREINPD